jgi:hypothetical protein
MSPVIIEHDVKCVLLYKKRVEKWTRRRVLVTVSNSFSAEMFMDFECVEVKI